jgi:glycosyltransferase 2 family protein
MDWKTIKKIFPIIGIGLFIYLLIKLDVTKIFQEIKNFNLFLLPLILILVIMFYIIQTLKWFVIARKQKINISFRESFKINWIANFYGFVTPGKIGTFMRTDYLKKKGATTGKGLSNFVLDKVLDLSSLFILTFVFGFAFYKKVIPEIYLFFIGIIFVIMILLFLAFYKKDNCKILLKFVYNHFIPERLKEKSRILFHAFYEDFPSLRFMLFVFIINLICWVTNYFIIYIIAISIGINVNFFYFLVILSISTIVAQIPITINGLGTRELTLISLFSVLGISSVKVFSMSILSIVIMNIIPAIIAIIFICKKEK